MMSFRVEVLPFLAVAAVAGVVLGVAVRAVTRRRRRPLLAVMMGLDLAILLGAYFLYFFRDPERTPPADPAAIVAGADGVIAKVTELDDAAFGRSADFSGLKGANRDRFLGRGGVVRVSIFLSLVDVHVNRAPISGQSEFLGYFPGKHFFTYKEKSSEHNQHNSILIRGKDTSCLVNQIVGPVARRVVYWPDHDRAVELRIGDRIGMMKFGSRLDMYLPRRDVEVLTRQGDRVRAGETIVARLRGEAAP
jgi:phosphatidylserine decarboxylase